MQKKHFPQKALSVALSLLMILTVIPLFPAITAGAKYTKEYYYPAGTKFIKDVAIYYSEDGDKAMSNITAAVTPNGYVLTTDLNKGCGRGTVYVYVGYTYTENPNEAVRGFRVDHNGSKPDNWSQSGVMWYPINSGLHSWVPQLTTDGRVDLNRKISDSDDLELYITKDPSFGPPLTALYCAGSTTERDNYNAAGWTPVVTFQNNAYQVDVNKGAGGDDLFLCYTTVCTEINTSSLRSAYSSTAGYISTDGYTLESRDVLATARNKAEAVIEALDGDKYQGCYTYSQSQLTGIVNEINRAVNNLQTNLYLNASENGGTPDRAVPVTIGKNSTATVDLSQYEATKTGYDFIGWATSPVSAIGTTGTVTVGFNNTYYALFGIELTANFHYLLENGTIKTETKTVYAMNSANAASTPKPTLNAVTLDGKELTPLGWREDTTADVNTIDKNGIYTIYTSNPTVDVYAVYSAPISLNYDTNGGNEIAGTTQTQYINVNTEITKSSHTFTSTSTDPVREGVDFIGWSLSSADVENTFIGEKTFENVTEDITLYAVYDVMYYTVNFVDGNGTTIKTEKVAYGDDATAPTKTPTKTCTEEKHYTFSGWDKTFSNVKTDLTVTALFSEDEHDFNVSTITAAGCLTGGTDKHSCDCGYEKEVDVAPLGHDKAVDTGTPATCTKPGETDYITCLRCLEVLQEREVIPALQHSFKLSESKPATCSTGGYEIWVCENNTNHKETRNGTSPTGQHNPETVKGKPATCLSNGLTDGSKCKDCGCILVPQNTILSDGHDLETDAYVAPTCYSTGLTKGSHCLDCDYKVEQQIIPKLEHDWEDFTATPATCDKDGRTAGRECKYCHTVENSTVIPALNHDWTITPVSATCTQDGYTSYVCSYDSSHNHIEKGEAATGHTGGEATCKAKAVCTNCGTSYGKLGDHKYSTTVFPATCTSQGFTRHTCSACNTYYDDTYTTTSAHTYNTGVITTVPGCCTDGVKTFTCLYCDDYYTEVVSATGHNVNDWTVEGTQASGTCDDCGESVTANPEDVGLELPECERCGMVHRYNSGLFKYKGIYCSIVYFFRQITNFFKGNA